MSKSNINLIITKTKKQILGEAVLHVLVPIFIGSLIYILFRKESLTVFLWLKQLSIYELTVELSNSLVELKNRIPFIILYSLPDGIWVYSATYLMLIIWEEKWKNRDAFLWVALPFICSIGAELLQFFHIIDGSFCLYDMTFCLFGFILPIHFIKLRRNYVSC